MSKEIFELPEHLDKVREEPKVSEKKEEIQLDAVEKAEVKTEVKPKRVRKVIDEETRELLLDKLKKSRKIKDLTAETTELKEKLAKLESAKAEPVPMVKYDESKVKKTITRKIKTIEEPIQKKEEVSLKPLVENKLLEVPKQPTIHSTWRKPIW
jgi:hypothetical protein